MIYLNFNNLFKCIFVITYVYRCLKMLGNTKECHGKNILKNLLALQYFLLSQNKYVTIKKKNSIKGWDLHKDGFITTHEHAIYMV